MEEWVCRSEEWMWFCVFSGVVVVVVELIVSLNGQHR